MKPKLRLPLREALEDGFDEATVQRIWHRVQARSVTRRNASLGVWALAAAIVVLVGAFALTWKAGTPTGPLQATDGRVPSGHLMLSSTHVERLDLMDGSWLRAAPGTNLDVIANDGNQFAVALRFGSLHLSVRPGGPRRWVVESGPVRVEVVGTEFEIDRQVHRVMVAVERGVVVVRGEGVPDRVQRLAAGARLVVPLVGGSDAQPDATAQRALGVNPSKVDPEPQTTLVEAPAQTAIATGAAIGNHAGVAEELLERANQARRQGDRALAVQLLRQAIAQGHDRPAGGIAALTLARLIMVDDPAGAARTLQQALRAQMPRALEEDARARLVEALRQSGDSSSARAAAEEFKRQFPNGARLGEVERWISE